MCQVSLFFWRENATKEIVTDHFAKLSTWAPPSSDILIERQHCLHLSLFAFSSLFRHRGKESRDEHEREGQRNQVEIIGVYCGEGEPIVGWVWKAEGGGKGKEEKGEVRNWTSRCQRSPADDLGEWNTGQRGEPRGREWWRWQCTGERVLHRLSSSLHLSRKQVDLLIFPKQFEIQTFTWIILVSKYG